MDRGYFKTYYNLERSHWWFLARAEILDDHILRKCQLKINDSAKILNIGVATYRTSEMLKKHGDVTSLEYDKECCQFIREELHQEVINGSITALPFADSSFDLICAFDVIEHVKEDQLAVDEMLRVTKSGGVIFVSVPAYKFLWGAHDIINHHYRRYTYWSLKSLFSQSSMIITSSYFNFLLFPVIASIRLLQNLWPSKSQPSSDFDSFKSNFFNQIFFKIFIIEKYLLRISRLPFGVSILLLARKK